MAITCGSLTSLGVAQDLLPAAQGIVGQAPKSESDEDFIRRMSKDLRGNDPTPAEIHFFVVNKDAGRRQKLIDLFIQEGQAGKRAANVEGEFAKSKTFMQQSRGADNQVQRSLLVRIDDALREVEIKIKDSKTAFMKLVEQSGSGDPAVLSLKQKNLQEEYGILNRLLINIGIDIRSHEALLKVQKMRREDFEKQEAELIEEILENTRKWKMSRLKCTASKRKSKIS